MVDSVLFTFVHIMSDAMLLTLNHTRLTFFQVIPKYRKSRTPLFNKKKERVRSVRQSIASIPEETGENSSAMEMYRA